MMLEYDLVVDDPFTYNLDHIVSKNHKDISDEVSLKDVDIPENKDGSTGVGPQISGTFNTANRFLS